MEQFSIENGATAMIHWDGYTKDALQIRDRVSDTVLEIDMTDKITQTNTFVVIFYVKIRGK